VVPSDEPATAKTPWLQGLHPTYRLLMRWAFIALLVGVAFHNTIISAWATTTAGGLGGYVWIVPMAALLTAGGIAVRKRTELPIHDRQTDVIVAILGLGMSALLYAVLMPRYALYYHLLRLDLVALWMFLVSCCVALFGLRPTIRFGWAWAVLFTIFPLPYYILVISLGGNRTAAGIGTMMIAAFATAVAVGRKASRGMMGANAAWAVGLLVLGVMAVFFRDANPRLYQYLPAMTAMLLVGSAMYRADRRHNTIVPLQRKVEPLAANQIWSAVPLVAVVALALSLVPLPKSGLAPPMRVPEMNFAAQPAAPPGWHLVESQQYDWVVRFYGRGSTLVRQRFIADTGNPVYDKFSRPRTIVVDTITTPRPFSLNVFPARMIYRISGIRQSGTRAVDLGYGTQADLFSVVDDSILVTWDGLQWTWTNGRIGRRVLAIAVDNHEDNAPFPQPAGGTRATVESLFTVLFRGNAAVEDDNPHIKDDALLSEFGHAMVRGQLQPLGYPA